MILEDDKIDEQNNDGVCQEAFVQPTQEALVQQQRRQPRQRNLPQSLLDFELFPDNAVTDEGDLLHFALLVEAKPIDYEEALNQELWRAAMIEELEAIEGNKTWVLTELPHGKKPIDVKWVFKIKQNPDGSISKRKVRLVARGFLQKQGVD